MIDLSPITNPRSREILERRLVAHETFASISKRYGITRERIRQICNTEVSNLQEDSYHEAIKAMDWWHLDAVAKKRSIAERSRIRSSLKAALKVGFDRLQILSITGLENDQDMLSMGEIDLCQWLYDEFLIRDFFKYFWCNRCEAPKLRSEFPPIVRQNHYNVKGGNRYCTSCNSARHREILDRRPELREKEIEWQKANPNRCKIFILRHNFKSTGRPELMPPLPPLGTPDCDIKVPNFGQGWGSWWGKRSPKEKADIVQRRLKGWRNWFDNLTAQQKQALGRKASSARKGLKKPRHAS